MSFTTQTIHEGTIPGGMRMETHMVAFSGNNASVTLNTNLKQIKGFSFGHTGTPGTTELLSINNTVADYGQIVVTNGQITIQRAATTTSGLIVCVTLYGV